MWKNLPVRSAISLTQFKTLIRPTSSNRTAMNFNHGVLPELSKHVFFASGLTRPDAYIDLELAMITAVKM